MLPKKVKVVFEQAKISQTTTTKDICYQAIRYDIASIPPVSTDRKMKISQKVGKNEKGIGVGQGVERCYIFFCLGERDICQESNRTLDRNIPLRKYNLGKENIGIERTVDFLWNKLV